MEELTEAPVGQLLYMPVQAGRQQSGIVVSLNEVVKTLQLRTALLIQFVAS